MPLGAQTVKAITLNNVPAELIPEGASAGNASMAPELDLGDVGRMTAPARAAGVNNAFSKAGAGAMAAARATPNAGAMSRSAKAQRSAAQPTERVVFERQPILIPLPLGRERLITLPAPAALHIPNDMEQVARVEVIDRTIYITALVPFAPMRIVAELVDGGEQIPLDLQASKATAAATMEMEIFVGNASSGPAGRAAAAARGIAPAPNGNMGASGDSAEPPAADMVQLVRYAARMLYAPRRLAYNLPSVSQVPVSTASVPGLVRGALVDTAPLGQWRSGNLFVTAVRITNKSSQPLEIPLDNLRGRWVAASAQHGRIGASGSETDTTALYLVCERSFEACL